MVYRCNSLDKNCVSIRASKDFGSLVKAKVINMENAVTMNNVYYRTYLAIIIRVYVDFSINSNSIYIYIYISIKF